jgi:hypothetical protein
MQHLLRTIAIVGERVFRDGACSAGAVETLSGTRHEHPG